MKTCFKKIVSLTLGLALILSLCIPKPIRKEAQAKPIDKTEFNYVALGDSVSYGMSATDKGYTDLLSDYINNLHRTDTVNYTNLSIRGDTSRELLNLLTGNINPFYPIDPIEAIKNADFITINIGGNNLLGPVIAALCTAFKVGPDNLAVAISTAMQNNPVETQALLLELSKSSDLRVALGNGVVAFAAEFPKIISEIKTLAPNATIYVNNLYNPFDELDPFYQIFNPFISTINEIINENNQFKDYNVVDVYGEFSNYTGDETLVDFNVATASLDPHPTDAGHELIFKAHLLPGIKGKINRYVGYRHKK